MWGNTVAIHNVLKKKTTKLNSQPAQYEKKKNRQWQFWKKKQKHHKKNKWGNSVAIYSVLKKKNYKVKFSTNSILKK